MQVLINALSIDLIEGTTWFIFYVEVENRFQVLCLYFTEIRC